MRLIDADALIRELKGIKVTFGSGNGLVEGGIEIAISTTNAQPTVDAVERKRGRWIPIAKGERGYSAGDFRCSVCGDPCKCYHLTNYCPNCGARMRGKAKIQSRT